MSKKPQRIQLKRTRGFRLQEVSRKLNGLPAVKVARPTKWGNPYPVQVCKSSEEAVGRYREWLERSARGMTLLRDIEELRGKNLACFCPLNMPCHADILLELANR